MNIKDMANEYLIVSPRDLRKWKCGWPESVMGNKFLWLMTEMWWGLLMVVKSKLERLRTLLLRYPEVPPLVTWKCH